MIVRRASDYKALGGKLVRVRITENNGTIESVRISGDFFLVPEEQLPKLEKTLIGAPLKERELKLLIDRFFVATRAKGLGVSPDDFVKAILSARPEG
jgi:lipoate---protein ligase